MTGVEENINALFFGDCYVFFELSRIRREVGLAIELQWVDKY